VSTDWLNSFAPSAHGKYIEKISLKQLLDYWSAGAQDQQIQEIQAQLKWFADALTKAKALRNENNYEALLIAHEYRHEYLDKSFKKFANAMAAVSKAAVTVAVTSYARMLRSEVSAESGTPCGDGGVGSAKHAGETAAIQERRLEAAFISRCVQQRIVEPARDWYGTDVFVVAKAVGVLMEPLTDLSQGQELDVTRMDELVSTDLFAPKLGLMDNLRAKIDDLHQLLNKASTDCSGHLEFDLTSGTKA
jgi:hypothetical protein